MKGTGVQAFVMKPLAKKEISRTIRKALDERDRQGEGGPGRSTAPYPAGRKSVLWSNTFLTVLARSLAVTGLSRNSLIPAFFALVGETVSL